MPEIIPANEKPLLRLLGVKRIPRGVTRTPRPETVAGVTPHAVPRITDRTADSKISADKYIITISDNGIGIPQNILGKIFDPFFRADTSRNTEGAGLGLTLSKKIVENHKGTIFVKSEENKGTRVIISLPISS